MAPSPTPSLLSVVTYPELHASLGFGLLLGFWEFLPASWRLPALGLLEVILLLKEALFDPAVEGPTQPFLWEGVKDFAWYHAGYAVALGFLFFR
jgi:hypothetical protein